MERGRDTGFKDKFGRSIHVDDVLQHRLGKFGKAGEPRNNRVIEFQGKYQLVSESEANLKYGGASLSNDICDYLVVLRCDHMPN